MIRYFRPYNDARLRIAHHESSRFSRFRFGGPIGRFCAACSVAFSEQGLQNGVRAIGRRSADMSTLSSLLRIVCPGSSEQGTHILSKTYLPLC